MGENAKHNGAGPGGVMPPWTILSSHGLVLFFVAANPDATLRETALALGLTERRVSGVVRDLASAGMVCIERRGRNNHYVLNPEARLPHPTVSHIPLGRIAAALGSGDRIE
jgi:DNA-binding transcriptional ArsR family regulator